MNPQNLESFAAPQDGCLTPDMLDSFKRNGTVILQDFVTKSYCEALRERTLELVSKFDPDLPLRGFA